MKRGDQHPILTGHDRLAAMLGQHLDAGSHPPDPGCSNEKHLERNRLAVELRRPVRLERFALAAVGIALDGDVDEPERELLRALDLRAPG